MTFLKWVAIFLSASQILFSPIVLFFVLFGLSGSYPPPFYIIGIAYFISIIASLISIRFIKALILIPFCFVAIYMGNSLDQDFWDEHNKNLCKELRANKTCKESASGFSCDDFHGGGFSVAIGICN